MGGESLLFMTEEDQAHLSNIARDIRAVLLEIREVTKYMVDAESEVAEKMRRFIMYMHDIHDICHIYEERGLPVPSYVLREMERCDDRFRHLLEDAHADQGTFERVRQEMTERTGNRWDWSHQLMKPKDQSEK